METSLINAIIVNAGGAAVWGVPILYLLTNLRERMATLEAQVAILLGKK